MPPWASEKQNKRGEEPQVRNLGLMSALGVVFGRSMGSLARGTEDRMVNEAIEDKRQAKVKGGRLAASTSQVLVTSAYAARIRKRKRAKAHKKAWAKRAAR